MYDAHPVRLSIQALIIIFCKWTSHLQAELLTEPLFVVLNLSSIGTFMSQESVRTVIQIVSPCKTKGLATTVQVIFVADRIFIYQILLQAGIFLLEEKIQTRMKYAAG